MTIYKLPMEEYKEYSNANNKNFICTNKITKL